MTNMTEEQAFLALSTAAAEYRNHGGMVLFYSPEELSSCEPEELHQELSRTASEYIDNNQAD